MTLGSGRSGDGEPLLKLRGVAKQYGTVEAVRPLDLEIERGDFFAILGPSGCGKTTLLRMIGGFVRPTAGSIEIDGIDATRLPPERRPTNMVFQGYGLFPHMDVRQNISYGLRLARVPQAEIRQRVDEILRLGQIEELAGRSVHELSGGQQQRVALARALVMRPKVLLLDEPLAALDLKLRQTMQEELRRLHQQIGGTFVFVTHDQGEALGLANRIAVMQAGVIIQEGTPEEIYSAPRTRFVATFIGEANVFEGRRRTGRLELACGLQFEDAGADEPAIVVLRPEKLLIDRVLAKTDFVLPAKLVDYVFLGTHIRFQLQLSSGQGVTVHSADLALRDRLRPGDVVQVGWFKASQRVLDGN